ncbi:nitroreductase family protein [Pseudolactococcus yaeyamensis]
MEFSILNQIRHAVRTFNGEKINSSLVEKILAEATLVPSAYNIQPWYFAIIDSDEKRLALSTALNDNNIAQHESAGSTLVVYSDSDLSTRVQELVNFGGGFLSGFKSEDLLKQLPQLFDAYSKEQLASYLSLNAGLVAQNIVLTANNRNIKTNILLGFDKEKVQTVLGLDKRYNPELVITLGYSEETGRSSYCLPVTQVSSII